MPIAKIKVGLLIDSLLVPAWIYESMKRIAASEYATISLVIKKQRKHHTSGVENWHYLVYHLYRKFENKYSKLNPNAFQTKNISDLIHQVPVINIQSFPRDYFDVIDDEQIDVIRNC